MRIAAIGLSSLCGGKERNEAASSGNFCGDLLVWIKIWAGRDEIGHLGDQNEACGEWSLAL